VAERVTLEDIARAYRAATEALDEAIEAAPLVDPVPYWRETE
jgi:hypothetical protein